MKGGSHADAAVGPGAKGVDLGDHLSAIAALALGLVASRLGPAAIVATLRSVTHPGALVGASFLLHRFDRFDPEVIEVAHGLLREAAGPRRDGQGHGQRPGRVPSASSLAV